MFPSAVATADRKGWADLPVMKWTLKHDPAYLPFRVWKPTKIESEGIFAKGGRKMSDFSLCFFHDQMSTTVFDTLDVLIPFKDFSFSV